MLNYDIDVDVDANADVKCEQALILVNEERDGVGWGTLQVRTLKLTNQVSTKNFKRLSGPHSTAK